MQRAVDFPSGPPEGDIVDLSRGERSVPGADEL